ncbi:MAG: metal-sensitive transcriptional regulator [Patescibacteria group bacterium]
MKPVVKKGVMRRLKIVEGQVRGLQKMIEADKYCIDVLHQTLAVKQALSGVEDVILENHLATHVVEQIKSGKESQSTKEIMELYKLSKKK